MLRRARRFLAATALAGLFLAAAYWSAGLELRWSWAAAGPGRLTEASVDLLARLEGPVTITAAVPEGHLLRRHLERLAAAYREHHRPVRLSFVDPEADPEAVREHGLTRTGELMLGYRDRHERVASPSEARISAAIERLLRREDRFVAYLAGHGERSLDGQRNHDLGQLGRVLERRGHRLQPLSLARTPTIPDNTAVLVVADPRGELSPGERTLLAEHVERGGNLLWLTEPGAGVPWPEALPVAPVPGVLVDPRAEELLAVEDPRLLLLEGRPGHPATDPLEAPLLLPQAAALETEETEAWQVRPLLRTGSRHWAERDFRADAVPRRGAGEAGGPLTVGVALSRPAGDGEQRVVIVGDTDFLSNTYLGNGGNLPFGVNLMDWLTGGEAFIHRYTAAAPDQRLEFSRAELLGIGLGLLFGLPAVLLLGTVWTWRRRRRG